MGDYYRLGRLCPFLTTNGDTPFGVVLERDPLGTYMGKLVPPPPYFDVAESEYQLRFGGWGGYYRVFGRARAPFGPPHISTPLSQIQKKIAFSESATSK
jgi:hypothetical protein